MDNQQHDRRAYDPRVMAVIDKVDQHERRIDKQSDALIAIDKRVMQIENTQSGALKDLSEHEQFMRLINTFVTETKATHASFDMHMKQQADWNKAQSVLNETLTLGIKKTTEFQNKLLLIGGIVVLLWQLFGAKVFTAAEVLIK